MAELAVSPPTFDPEKFNLFPIQTIYPELDPKGAKKCCEPADEVALRNAHQATSLRRSELAYKPIDAEPDDEGPHRFLRIHVAGPHEPAGGIGADRHQHEHIGRAAGDVLAFPAVALRLHHRFALGDIAHLAAIASAFEFHDALPVLVASGASSTELRTPLCPWPRSGPWRRTPAAPGQAGRRREDSRHAGRAAALARLRLVPLVRLHPASVGGRAVRTAVGTPFAPICFWRTRMPSSRPSGRGGQPGT
mgnify:CR=1 FL=1